MILQKCYYVFNEQIELYPASYGILSLKAKVFNASGGQDVTYLYAYNGMLRWDIGDTTSGLMYNDSNPSFAIFGWQLANYRFLEITEESEISEDFYNWFLENGTFIDSSVYIKSGNYNFNNQASYSSYTANTFLQLANFVVGNTLGCYAIAVLQFSVGYNTSEGGVNYVYPYNTGNYNSNYYLLTFNEDTFITKECAIWFIYMCIYNGIATKPSDVVYKQIIPTGYSITFESNGGSSIPTQNNVTNITNLPTPTRQGYSFNGWYYDSLFINRAKIGDTLTSNVTLYASWSLITYRVDYVTNPSIATAPQSISGVTKLPTPLPTPSIIEFQYTFIGWYYDSQYLTQAFAGDTLNSNVTLYGKFEIGTYDVNFVTNGGTAVSSITGVSNLPSPLPTTTRDGYVFDGWYYDDEYSRRAYAGEALFNNVTLYAKFEIVTYNVDFVTNGGTAVASIIGVSNLPSPLPTTTRDGYVFDGWYYDDEYSRRAYAGDALFNNVTLYAKWEVEIVGDFVMNIYQFSGEEIMVDKRNYMRLLGTLRGTMRDEINIVSPMFTMTSDKFPNFNYVYIPNFRRYYYVANINCVRYNFYEITLTLDVLMSYREGVLSLNAFIDRSESNGNNLIIDDRVVAEQGVNIKTYSINTSKIFSTYSYVINGSFFNVELGVEEV